MLPDVLERLGLPVGEHDGLGVGVVAVATELGDDAVSRVGDALGPELAGHVVGGHAQVLGGEVRSEVGAVAEHRPVLLQPSRLE